MVHRYHRNYYLKNYTNILHRKFCTNKYINRNFYYGNLIDENETINLNCNTKLFFYINDKTDLAKYNFFLNKYSQYQKKFFKIYTKQNDKKENLFSVFTENLSLLKKNLYYKGKRFEFNFGDLISKNFYFYLLDNVIDLNARKDKFSIIEKLDERIKKNYFLSI